MSDANSLGLGSYATLLAPGASPSLGVTSKTGKADTPEATAKAAGQFEALLIGQFLKAAREASGSSWMGTDSEDANAGMIELAEQQLSQALAARGGLGLAKLVSEGLTKAEKIGSGDSTNQQ